MFDFANLTKENIKDIKIQDIIDWCKANNETAWLKAKASEERDHKKYPKIEVFDEATQKTVKRVDKSATPTIVKERITFIELKSAFLKEKLGYKAKEKNTNTFYDLIDNL